MPIAGLSGRPKRSSSVPSSSTCYPNRRACTCTRRSSRCWRIHHRQYTAALLAEPHPSVDEHEAVRPDGTIGWQQWIDHAIRDAGGHLVEFQAIGRDITERKRAEEALRESEARFRAAFESAATGMMMVGTDGHPLQVNRPLVEMLGYTEEELHSQAET